MVSKGKYEKVVLWITVSLNFSTYRNIILIFDLVKAGIFLWCSENFIVSFALVSPAFSFFVLCWYKVFDIEYRPYYNKSSKTSTKAITIDSQMLKLLPNHLKHKKMCKHAVQKLSWVTNYVSD